MHLVLHHLPLDDAELAELELRLRLRRRRLRRRSQLDSRLTRFKSVIVVLAAMNFAQQSALGPEVKIMEADAPCYAKPPEEVTGIGCTETQRKVTNDYAVN